ncbi:hypothetical protein M2350_000419 [Candidatus Fervidibacter sacchari]|uniref:Uncharacterized protein n=1 Tax=Candidatus Fervidibacter sacchari TaxID=1448929 RepID=A0ABT2EJ92_9BACT|nr:hypothetical protein [Candidatus Fervidibacter sacchari]
MTRMGTRFQRRRGQVRFAIIGTMRIRWLG